MVDNNQQLEELFQRQYEKDKEIIDDVEQSLRQVFVEEKQFEVVFDLYKQVFKLSQDLQELNHANIFLNSYIDSFHQLLVGEGKLLDDDQFRELASDSYHASLQAIMNITKEESNE